MKLQKKNIVLIFQEKHIKIDESQFFKAKYNIGAGLSRDEIWSFGVMDSETLRVVVEICDDRKAETLIPIISTVKLFE